MVYCIGSRRVAVLYRKVSISINVCYAVAIVINKLSHLSDRVCNSCWRRKVRHLFQLCHLVKNSTKEESVQSPDRFVSNGNYRLLFRSLSEALEIEKCFE
jgi:ABC-type lipoprotein export system ATPase subunit